MIDFLCVVSCEKMEAFFEFVSALRCITQVVKKENKNKIGIRTIDSDAGERRIERKRKLDEGDK